MGELNLRAKPHPGRWREQGPTALILVTKRAVGMWAIGFGLGLWAIRSRARVTLGHGCDPRRWSRGIWRRETRSPRVQAFSHLATLR